MAKGLRSKSKVASRNAKRYDPKTDYAIVQAARLQQTASRLASKNKSSKTVTDEEAEEAEGEAAVTSDDKMMDEETSAEQEDKNGWYLSSVVLCCNDQEKGEKGRIHQMQRERDEAEDFSYLLLGLCDPDKISLADTDTDTDSETEISSDKRSGWAIGADAGHGLDVPPL